MKRLTTDTPDSNFETILNFVYGKDGWAYIRHDGEHENVKLTDWAAEQCICHDGCEDIFQDGVLQEEIDTTICDCMMDSTDCPIALAYCFASQAVHLRDRLKMYEDILFSEDGTELISLNRLREIVAQKDNLPLTPEELRKMDGEPVWLSGNGLNRWDILRKISTDGVACFLQAALPMECCGKTWIPYRRRLEEKAT